MKYKLLCACAASLLLLAACSSDKPTQPGSVTKDHVAGGGRETGNDPFKGGPRDSGPGQSGYGEFNGYSPLFYSDIACGETPKTVVITNQADWQAWWTNAVSCLPKFDSTWPWFDPGPVPADSNHGTIGWPSGPINPYGPDAPMINFDTSTIIAVSIEQDQAPGRFVHVTDAQSAPGGGSVIRYVVTTPAPDCMILMMQGGDSTTLYAPTTAVLVPKHLAEPVTWERTDTIMSCRWEPDPNMPITLYFTDAPCALGASETIITDEARFKEWIETAMECDIARFHRGGDSSGKMMGDTLIPSDPTLPPFWNGFDVDFKTHAVVILRAGEFTHWGGGIWLDDVKSSAFGTTIEYSVMEPGEKCPPVEDGGTVNPTAAIRVPLPLNQPITWDRHIEPIPCDWGRDSVIVWPDTIIIWPDSNRVPPDSLF